MTTNELDRSLAEVIELFSSEGATMIIPDGGNPQPASSLQISYLLWTGLLRGFLQNQTDNELRSLAYSNDADIRRFVSDLIVLHIRDTLAKPPLNPGEQLVINSKVQKAFE